MSNRAGKGSAFERRICKMLSEWWTGGERDDVFWRTSNSGGRATVRGKKGSRTANQHGDICAVDPVGQPLIDLVTFELKRGYNDATVADLLDAPPTAKDQTYGAWFRKIAETAKAAGAPWWMLIAQRDRRVPVAWMPLEAWVKVREPDDSSFIEDLIRVDWAWCQFVGIRLGDLLADIRAGDFVDRLGRTKNSRRKKRA